MLILDVSSFVIFLFQDIELSKLNNTNRLDIKILHILLIPLISIYLRQKQ